VEFDLIFDVFEIALYLVDNNTVRDAMFGISHVDAGFFA